MSLHRRLSRTIAVSLVAGAMAITAQPAQAASITEGFDDVAALTGWQKVNLSTPQADPATTTQWRQGDPSYFPAHSGAENSYISVDFQSTSDAGDASNWLIAPQQTSLSSTDVLSFWTRTIDLPGGGSNIYPDRLEVRMSTNGSCSPGTTADGVGDFTTLLASVNPTLADDGYPRTWTQYTVPVGGLGTTNVSGCIAFRYFITDTGNNGETIGIDSVSFTDNASTACTTAQASAASAQATVTSATATLTAANQAVTSAKKALKKAKKKLKKARKADAPAKKVKKLEKKVKKAKKALKRARTKNAAATTALGTAQAALTSAQTASTSSCP